MGFGDDRSRLSRILGLGNGIGGLGFGVQAAEGRCVPIAASHERSAAGGGGG